MCIQLKDSIIINGVKYDLYTYPLDSCWTKRNPKPLIRIPITNCWRGYVATWEISKDHLSLVNLIFHSQNGDYGIDFIFPKNEGKIKADWYNGELQIPIGNELNQEFMADPVYESDWFINIKKGEVLSHHNRANY